MPPSPQPATHRFDTIDLLRGLSILAVVLMHAQTELLARGCNVQPHLPAWLFALLFFSGGTGVLVFFTVSGFLITLTAARRFGSLTQCVPGTFYRIRFARIAPPLLALLLVLGTLHLAGAPGFHIAPAQTSLPRALLAVLTLHFNLFQAQRGFLPTPWIVLWSLSVEEVFYLFFPSVRFFARHQRLGLLLFIALLAAGIAFPATAYWPLGPANIIWRGENYLLGFKNIMVGCLFAVLVDRFQRRNPTPNLSSRPESASLADAAERPAAPAAHRFISLAGCALFLLALLPYLSASPSLNPLRRLIDATSTQPLLFALGTGLLMTAATLYPRRGHPCTAPLRWFGRYSYEVYLTHQFIVVLAGVLFARLHAYPITVWLGAIIILSGLLGLLLAKLLSEPMNRLLRGAPLPSQLRP